MLHVLMKGVRWIHLEQIWRCRSMHTTILISVMQCVHVPRLLRVCVCVCVCVLNRFSCVSLFATLWTVAHQVPLSMGLSRQECWSGLPCPPPRSLLSQGSNPCLSLLLHWLVGSLPLVPRGKLRLLHKIKITSRLYFLLWDDPI